MSGDDLRSGYERSAFLYDLFDRKPNVDFFRRVAAGSASVLDVGAGTGRIALPLARDGHEVTCVEPSPAMRAVLVGKLRDKADLGGRVHILAAK